MAKTDNAIPAERVCNPPLLRFVAATLEHERNPATPHPTVRLGLDDLEAMLAVAVGVEFGFLAAAPTGAIVTEAGEDWLRWHLDHLAAAITGAHILGAAE